MGTIENVEMGESLCSQQLSTTGVYTCFAVAAHLDDDTSFIHHISSTDFNLDAKDLRVEAQQMLEKSFRRLNKCKGTNASLKYVFITQVNESDIGYDRIL
jgi:outer membrane protein OmpA-like peptidoglycan-associated protein